MLLPLWGGGKRTAAITSIDRLCFNLNNAYFSIRRLRRGKWEEVGGVRRGHLPLSKGELHQGVPRQPLGLRLRKGDGSLSVSVAQWIAHRTSNPGHVGSSPTVDAIFDFLHPASTPY